MTSTTTVSRIIVSAVALLLCATDLICDEFIDDGSRPPYSSAACELDRLRQNAAIDEAVNVTALIPDSG
jgi:hypothetical protein